VESKFQARFFPSPRYVSAKYTIAIFSQEADEPLCEALERCKSLLRGCPNHGFDDGGQLHIFCNVLRPQTKMILDASARGSIMFKIPDEAKTIIEAIVASDHQVHHDKSISQRRGVLELDTQNVILAQNKILTQ